MLGYMTIAEAKENGFTHHAKYYGLPCYVSDDADFTVAVKWAPLDYLFLVVSAIEGFISQIMWPESEPSFMFVMGEKL